MISSSPTIYTYKQWKRETKTKAGYDKAPRSSARAVLVWSWPSTRQSLIATVKTLEFELAIPNLGAPSKWHVICRLISSGAANDPTQWHRSHGSCVLFFRTSSVWLVCFVLGPHLSVSIRAHYWQWSGSQVGCWGSNPGWPHTTQASILTPGLSLQAVMSHVFNFWKVAFEMFLLLLKVNIKQIIICI